MAASSSRPIGLFMRNLRVPRRAFGTSSRLLEAAVPATKRRQRRRGHPAQAGRPGTQPRRHLPQPLSAMEMIHKQRVRWTHERVVACEGGGGPAGHPRIFINTDKPEISVCNYCGLPFAHEHHREHLESLAETSYPLS
ncbi:NADH:ubiquinone oxidoreductase 18.4kD subunit [Ophiocordyceps sinensis CO18]|uniref:NADH:ubiquinone oxidoreductase 18.4kD subunit n=1 Tax=Ophiocordyceps sinensis (strain Co18 / CGMCC 3.14243) TaxID=911162 RepID=T5A8T4_OPHSC|nr:NADH:ubiquinone oxidoreductase 18.4kD subunit [Ophiocordyceps sinensis CO18]